MAQLYDCLRTYAEGDVYPFHMPGHKRRSEDPVFRDMFGIDITEIDGFDNLHRPTGLLKRMQDEAADIYGARQTFFLVNGSTCGILAAVSAAVGEGKRLLMARNCHRAAYHACLLRGIDAEYIYPSQTDQPELCGDIRAEEVADALGRYADIGAVLITSPNYDGIVSDVRTIAGIVHGYGAALIVDEAHGAHLPFADGFPESALFCGADIVIQSLHKTLPSPTQTALLHRCSDRVDADRLREFLVMYETSSPSYVFLAAMQQCIERTAAQRKEWFDALSGRLDAFERGCGELGHLRLLSRGWARRNGIYDFDRSKILIFPENCGLNGKQLYEILLSRYRLQMEMASMSYVMGIATVCDTDEGFARLLQALRAIDGQITPCLGEGEDGQFRVQPCAEGSGFVKAPVPVRRMSMHKAWGLARRRQSLREAKGGVSAEFAYLYPPGVPVLVPGEEITEEIADWLLRCRRMGLQPQGMRDGTGETIETVEAS